MLNRRHLRIKVLQILYAYYQSEDKDPLQSRKELDASIAKIYDLYIYFLKTFEDLVGFAEQKIEDKSQKIRPTEEDLNPNKNFVDNPVFRAIIADSGLAKASEKHKINWEGAAKHDLLRKLFVHIEKSVVYQEYMSRPTSDFERDMEFAQELFKTEIANFELIHDFFENESIYWMDDIDLVCTMVLKTMKRIEEKDLSKSIVLPLHKDKKDETEFIHSLLLETIKNDEENDALIDELARNWDLERIAKMDIILLKMAITELTKLTSIPKKVTLNEYIEISKFYSTPKSQVFINGILDRAVAQLESEGKLIKKGRGLID